MKKLKKMEKIVKKAYNNGKNEQKMKKRKNIKKAKNENGKNWKK